MGGLGISQSLWAYTFCRNEGNTKHIFLIHIPYPRLVWQIRHGIPRYRDKTRRTGNSERKTKRKQDERTTQQQTKNAWRIIRPQWRDRTTEAKAKAKTGKTWNQAEQNEQIFRTQPTNCTAQARQTRPSAHTQTNGKQKSTGTLNSRQTAGGSQSHATRQGLKQDETTNL